MDILTADQLNAFKKDQLISIIMKMREREQKHDDKFSIARFLLVIIFSTKESGDVISRSTLAYNLNFQPKTLPRQSLQW